MRKMNRWLAGILSAAMVMTSITIPVSATEQDISVIEETAETTEVVETTEAAEVSSLDGEEAVGADTPYQYAVVDFRNCGVTNPVDPACSKYIEWDSSTNTLTFKKTDGQETIDTNGRLLIQQTNEGTGTVPVTIYLEEGCDQSWVRKKDLNYFANMIQMFNSLTIDGPGSLELNDQCPDSSYWDPRYRMVNMEDGSFQMKDGTLTLYGGFKKSGDFHIYQIWASQISITGGTLEQPSGDYGMYGVNGISIGSTDRPATINNGYNALDQSIKTSTGPLPTVNEMIHNCWIYSGSGAMKIYFEEKPVEDITGVPETATAGIDLDLGALVKNDTIKVLPAIAKHKAITWSIKDAGTTGATVSDNVLKTTDAGDVVLTATIKDGKLKEGDFVKDFSIKVSALKKLSTFAVGDMVSVDEKILNDMKDAKSVAFTPSENAAGEYGSRKETIEKQTLYTFRNTYGTGSEELTTDEKWKYLGTNSEGYYMFTPVDDSIHISALKAGNVVPVKPQKVRNDTTTGSVVIQITNKNDITDTTGYGTFFTVDQGKTFTFESSYELGSWKAQTTTGWIYRGKNNFGSYCFAPAQQYNRLVTEETFKNEKLNGYAVVTLPKKNPVYTGTAVLPKIKVKYVYYENNADLVKGDSTKMKKKLLKQNTDYTISWINNVNAGTAQALITGIGDYSDTWTQTFTIDQKSIVKAVIEPISNMVSDGTDMTERVKSAVVVKDGLVTAPVSDYTVSFRVNGTESAAIPVAAEDQKIEVLVKAAANGNYKAGEAVKKSQTFTIYKPGTVKKEISGNAITFKKDPAADKKCVYSGKAVKPAVVVTAGGTVLKMNRDYKLVYTDNVAAGTAKVTAIGVKDYTGSVTASFPIAAKDIVKVAAKKPAKLTWNALEDEIKLTLKNGTSTLVEGIDYTVDYSGAKNITIPDGKKFAMAKIKVTAVTGGNYTGSREFEFKVVPRQMKNKLCIKAVLNTPVTRANVASDKNYKPDITITYKGDKLTEGTDYTIDTGKIKYKYKKIKVAGQTKKVKVPVSGVVVLIAKGNYKGTLKVSFNVSE